MAAYFTPNTPNVGSLNAPPYLGAPALPNIVAEWAAIIPLVCHLADFKRDYQIVGRMAMTRSISIGIFPRLGVLAGLARLLKNGPDFLDQASSRGNSSRTVWDVVWGCSFPTANGSASLMIAKYALEKAEKGVIKMPDTIPTQHKQGRADSASSADSNKTTLDCRCGSQSWNKSSTTRTSQISTTIDLSMPHRRYQTLNVLQFSRKTPRRSWTHRFRFIFASVACQIVTFVAAAGIAIALILFGCYGTATIVLCGSISQAACHAFTIERTPGYLESNEGNDKSYMLVSIHQNACVWYLFIGDRGVVDTLLNKTMIAVPQDSKRNALACLFVFTHCLQLLAMMFTTAEKAWDAMMLVFLMLLESVWRLQYQDGFLVRRWLEEEGVEVVAKKFEFTGRKMMLGAIQSFSGSDRTEWMDSIISPHPRRDAWLERLSRLAAGGEDVTVTNNERKKWGDRDWKYIDLSSVLAFASAAILGEEMKQEPEV
jgi:hypothetical protein